MSCFVAPPGFTARADRSSYGHLFHKSVINLTHNGAALHTVYFI
ncbi:unknown protein [Cronobacter turicensis z3032]|uniref:Uncharacterized protein n=1 Tax=Cronobacter turicensis (strain DSM 18703 / CCUG 55852 / LMG 23827 / z3032) TaxID=693216 RepID=C9XX59_CROTZ|nr:unknown protein [Cronobacter turicensis z3032]